MPPAALPLTDHAARLRGGSAGDGPIVLVDLDAGTPADLPELPPAGPVVVGLTGDPDPDRHRARVVCDVVLGRGDGLLDRLVANVERHPVAAATAAGVLRGSPRRTLDDGLVAESAAYSALQAGPEFAAWRAARPVHHREEPGPPVRVERDGQALHITLDRPEVRNALNTAMRDALVEAFALPAFDPSIAEVHLRGLGPAFCSGGDLDEFGTFPDPATAHVVRLQQSVGRAIALVAERVTAHLHGACAGSGIELPAFAGRVLAHPSTQVSLPELSLGLLPGAGGTVSLPRRIGRHRTAQLLLTGAVIDAATALDWGLVDAIAEEP